MWGCGIQKVWLLLPRGGSVPVPISGPCVGLIPSCSGPPCAPRPAAILWVVPVRGRLLCSPVSSSITASASLVRTTEAQYRISANEGSSTQWLLGSRSLWLAVQRLEHKAAVCRLLWGGVSQHWAGCSRRERAGPDGGTRWTSSRGSERKHIRNPTEDEQIGLDQRRQLTRNS